MPVPKSPQVGWNDAQVASLAAYLADPERIGWRAWKAGHPRANQATCNREAHRFFSRPDVQEYILARTAPAMKKLGLERDRILEEWAHVGLFDPARLYDEQGNLKHIKDMDPDVRRVIAGIDIRQRKVKTVTPEGTDETLVHEEQVVKLTFASKLKALEDAARHLRMFVNVVELRKADPLADLTDAELVELENELRAVLRREESEGAPSAVH